MQRGSEVILAQKTSHVSGFVFMRCCYVLCLPSSNTLVTSSLQDETHHFYSVHTHWPRTYSVQSTVQGGCLEALRRMRHSLPACSCMGLPGSICLAFLFLTWRQVYSLFSWLFSSCVDSFCRDAFEHVLDDVVWRNLIWPALCSPPSHLFFSLLLSC